MLRRRPVTAFFLVALLVSWVGWIPYASMQAGVVELSVPAELIWLCEFGPSLAALLVTGLVAGKAGVRRLVGRLGRWNVGARAYAFAVLVTPVLAALALVVNVALGGAWPDLSRLEAWDARFIERTGAFTPSLGLISTLVDAMTAGGPVVTGLVFVALALTNGGLSEELGWRGFALQEYLDRGKGLFTASILVGLLWGGWHTGPLFWKTMLTTGLGEAAMFTVVYLGQYLLLVVPLSFVYTALYVKTGGSVLLMVLLHASYNITIAVAASAWEDFPMLTLVVLLWVFGVFVLRRAGQRRGAATGDA